MGAAPNVRLTVPSRAENVLLVRQALTGLGEAVGLDGVALNDVSTAVTEAANNVVLHAYRGGEGTLEVELASLPNGLEVKVSDRGNGIPRALTTGKPMSEGIGIPVIQALSETVEFRERRGGGTEVAMHFAPVQATPLESGGRLQPSQCGQEPGGGSADSISLALAPAVVGRHVLPRVLSTLAARAHFTTDRISDGQLLTDTLVAALDGSAGGRLELEIRVAPRVLELRIGPLPKGEAARLFDMPAGGPLPSVLGRLTDGHSVSAEGASEILELRIEQGD